MSFIDLTFKGLEVSEKANYRPNVQQTFKVLGCKTDNILVCDVLRDLFTSFLKRSLRIPLSSFP